MKKTNKIIVTLGIALALTSYGVINNNDNNASAQTEQRSISTKSTALERPAPVKGLQEQFLTRTGYIVSYNKNTKNPNWVAWHLTAAHADGPYQRDGYGFKADTEVPTPRAVTGDYTNSGYDRGHMCPSGDNQWSELAQKESFIMTNICPQNHYLNIGDWSELEQRCRKLAVEYGDIYIVAGPIFNKGMHQTIGKNNVAVPDGFFKVVLCTKGTPKAIGFVFENERGNRLWSDYATTVDKVELATGIDFFPALPDKTEKKIEAKMSIAQWQ